jgi:hypothetical protein
MPIHEIAAVLKGQDLSRAARLDGTDVAQQAAEERPDCRQRTG